MVHCHLKCGHGLGRPSASLGRASVAMNSFCLRAGVPVIGLAWHWQRVRGGRWRRYWPSLRSACALAMALSAVQMLPVLEFSGQSWARGWRHRSITVDTACTGRVAELIWPNLYGTNFPENRCWLQAVPPVGRQWPGWNRCGVGGLGWSLAVAPPDSEAVTLAGWITTVLVGLAASFGKYGVRSGGCDGDRSRPWSGRMTS